MWVEQRGISFLQAGWFIIAVVCRHRCDLIMAQSTVTILPLHHNWRKNNDNNGNNNKRQWRQQQQKTTTAKDSAFSTVQVLYCAVCPSPSEIRALRFHLTSWIYPILHHYCVNEGLEDGRPEWGGEWGGKGRGRIRIPTTSKYTDVEWATLLNPRIQPVKHACRVLESHNRREGLHQQDTVHCAGIVLMLCWQYCVGSTL